MTPEIDGVRVMNFFSGGHFSRARSRLSRSRVLSTPVHFQRRCAGHVGPWFLFRNGLGYFFASGGYFFKSFATALLMFFCCFSGLALGSIVLVATPRQTRSCFAESYISKANCPL